MQVQNERRRHFDPTPRVEFVPVVNNTKLVQRNGYAHVSLMALDWLPLIVEDDFVLLQAPAGCGEVA